MAVVLLLLLLLLLLVVLVVVAIKLVTSVEIALVASEEDKHWKRTTETRAGLRRSHELQRAE